jgi:hypothetical protein
VEPAHRGLKLRAVAPSVFDLARQRGTGLSDGMEESQPFETRMDDVRAVMDSAGSERSPRELAPLVRAVSPI